MTQKIEIRIPYSDEMPLAFLHALNSLGIPCRFMAENGSGALLITMGDEEDEALLRLWDCLSDLRVRYIEAKQEEMVCG
jgi:hypothetical protein